MPSSGSSTRPADRGFRRFANVTAHDPYTAHD